MTAAMHVRARLQAVLAAATLAIFCAQASAENRRDIVFDCPCSAEWAADDTGEAGVLTVRGSLRSYRLATSGEVRLSSRWWDGADGASVGIVPPAASLAGEWTIPMSKSDVENVVKVYLLEESARDSDGTPQWHRHEDLALWPVPRNGEEDESGPMRFVGLLTDSDGDGVGDVNERLAGSDWQDSESIPGRSTIDVLALYTAAFRENEDGYPYTRLLHAISVASAMLEDSKTNIRLRMVGMSEVELGEDGWAKQEQRQELMDSHGADLSVQYGPVGPCTSGGCANLGAWRTSHWTDEQVWDGGVTSVRTTVHELGHVMGLVHSYRQGETGGAWRWSRGHYVTTRDQNPRRGTVMSYGRRIYGGVFSDPLADCGAGPCGVDAGELDGADSVATLNALRFQIAAHRAAGADTDGDGIVDAADAAPEDPDDWFDVDGDGTGDNADPDDDNDGVNDTDDAFPLDPNEWADADLDGIGDNADDDVQAPGARSLIRDLALLRIVEAALGKEPDSPITAEDLAGITELDASSSGIQDLTGLEWATGVERLRLAGNRISDLSPLSELEGLRYLYLEDNEVTDLAPLSGLSKLYLLRLSGNPVSDIGPLAGLTGLRDLVLNHTDAAYADVLALPYLRQLGTLSLAGLGIRDASALSTMTNLRSLNLRDNAVADIGPLAGLVNLTWLDLVSNGIADLSALSAMTKLGTLNLHDNAVVDIGPLAGLVELTWLDLSNNGVADVSVLSAMTKLRSLNLRDNAVADIGPLAGLVKLTWLALDNNGFADVSALSAMTELRLLDLGDNAIADVGPLAGLVRLAWLDLANNGFADVSAVSAMTELRELYLQNNAIVDVGPLSELVKLTALSLSDNLITDIGPLSRLVKLTWLHLGNNAIADVSALSAMTQLHTLILPGNAIVDIGPLSELARFTWLDLKNNRITDIGPLTEGAIFGGLSSAGAFVGLDGNPLDEASVETHLPQLLSSGVNVRFTRRGSDVRPTRIADPTLRSLIGEALARFEVHVDDPVPNWPMDQLIELRVHGARVADFAGLEAAAKLERLYAASNAVADLSPLAGLSGLSGLDLRDNRISDLGPLVSNADFGEGDWLNIGGNPLSEKSVNEDVPALLERGVSIDLSPVSLTFAGGGEPGRFKVSGYFESVLGRGFGLVEASTDDASVATVGMSGDDVVIYPNVTGSAGRVNVTVKARGLDGLTETLSFAVTFRGPAIVPFFPSDSGLRQGFVRVINRSGQAAQARIVAIDDTGIRSSPVTLAIGAGETVHFNATDLEDGNPDKGLSGSIGRGTGDWRLELAGADELDVYSFARAADGFMTAIHDVAAVSGSAYQVPVFNPASDLQQASSLRLVNRGNQTAEALITGVDDLGQSPGGEVRIEVPAGAAVTVTAAELESGGPGLRGRLGDGTGKWRLEVRSETDLIVMNLLSSLNGPLANLSGDGVKPRGDGVHAVPLFLSASDAMGRQGFVRVINRSASEGVVQIRVYDDQGMAYGPLELSLGAGHATHFDSRDLELGNVEKGLAGSAGSGIGDWRLELSTELDIRVLAYVRTSGGFLTPVHEGAPRTGRRYEVATFSAADNVDQRGRLRIVNPGTRPAHVSITGIDDAGESPGEVLRMSIPAGQSRTVTAEQLEAGFRGSQGALGDGTGTWRLVVDCEQPIVVMSLLEGVTGQLTNISP